MQNSRKKDQRDTSVKTIEVDFAAELSNFVPMDEIGLLKSPVVDLLLFIQMGSIRICERSKTERR